MRPAGPRRDPVPARIDAESEAVAPRKQERVTTAGIAPAAHRQVLPVITPPDHARLRMSAVRKRFGATVALDGVDLTVRPGEVHALIGENGAGKSTLGKIVSGAIPADAGEMLLDGRPYRPSNPLDARRNGIAMIYQELNLAPPLRVEEHIMLGIEEPRWGLLLRASMRRRVLAALEQLRHPDIRPDIRVRDLSPGAQQLVEIARALATLVVGSLLGLTVFLLDWFKESTGWSVNFMLAAFYLFVISSGVLVAVSLLRPSPADHPGRGLVWNNPLEALRGPAWRGIGNYRFLAALLFVTMVALYVVFS